MTNYKTLSYSKHLAEQRKRLVDWVHQRLIGPGEIDEPIKLPAAPVNLFVTAVLFPIVPNESGIDPASQSESDDEPEDDQQNIESPDKNKSSVKKTIRYIPPSAAGFSCYVSHDAEIDVFPWAVSYEKMDPKKSEWKRTPTGQTDKPVHFKSPKNETKAFIQIPIWDGRAEVTALWRRHENGWLVTLSLCNRQKNESITDDEYYRCLNEMSLFEVRFRAEIRTGEIYPYPQKDISLMDEEEQELDLLYRHHLVYAIGHGAAVDWNVHQKPPQLELDFFPSVEVPLVSPDVDEIDKKTLSISFLESCLKKPKSVLTALSRFVDAYQNWLTNQHKKNQRQPETDQQIGDRMLERVDNAVERMRDGIEFLRNNPKAITAFGLANEAMRRQMEIGDKRRGRDPKDYRWRPFQLGFFLLSLESVANENSKFRDVVDLIWFPTGGGKTEAYMALMAFLIIWRRLTYQKSGGGTVAILRYTLRLLTQQQFQRAIRLICALELLRRENVSLLGAEPISGGLWVGGTTTPNLLKEAFEEFQKAIENQEIPYRLVYHECPWCGSSLWKQDAEKINACGIVSDETRFEFHCPNPKCDFALSKNTLLPIQVVDEALYKNPPTLLLATVDKFARLAWEERATVFFGKGVRRPPELIIQDELHLITGALGTIAGLYEAGLDTVLKLRGVHPKYVASTATIRNASHQVQRLFGRQTAIFPPTSISIDDSFFARTIPIETMPGRLYLGYLAPFFFRKNSLTPLAAALLSAPYIIFANQQDQDILDAWWTLVVYHGSLQGVGDSDYQINYSVREYVTFLKENDLMLNEKNDQHAQDALHDNLMKQFMAIFDEKRREIVPLTSLNSEENSRTFSRMEKHKDDPDHVDVVLTTNMLSVGVDVARLALMVINGQPLTTAEYIQASSRIGRGDIPGIVIAHYYRNQARSLSHYENFRPFHESFYLYVEPGSVTPFTAQARQRALHAAMVITIRHGVDGLCCNDAAKWFDTKNTSISNALSVFKRRCCEAHPEMESAIQSDIDSLAKEWLNYRSYCERSKQKLVFYSGNSKNCASLLKRHDQIINGIWPTLNSMRNVEDTVMIKVTKPYEPPAQEEK
ncbi:MAG: helicase-related protein [Desulfatirhabdiaceae bacterium]